MKEETVLAEKEKIKKENEKVENINEKTKDEKFEGENLEKKKI